MRDLLNIKRISDENCYHCSIFARLQRQEALFSGDLQCGSLAAWLVWLRHPGSNIPAQTPELNLIQTC